MRILPHLRKQRAKKNISFEMLHIRTKLGFFLAACSEVIFLLTRDFQSVFQRDLQRFIQISDVTKKHSNVHSSLVDYCSRVTEHGVMKIPFSGDHTNTYYVTVSIYRTRQNSKHSNAKKHSNVHSGLVDYCSRVTEHSFLPSINFDIANF